MKSIEWKIARIDYLRLSKLRKLEGRNRLNDSEYMYLPLISLMFGKDKTFQLVLNTISDNLI